MTQAADDICYDMPAPGVARILLNRPQVRNAQNLAMLYALDAAFKRACGDRGIRVIVLAAQGPDFSSGHDLAFSSGYDPAAFDTIGLWGEFDQPGAEGFYAIEREIYLDLTERWRNAPKPTIAQVQGRCIAGGLMLVWACDLIVASRDASFHDNTVDMGMCGVEFFHHPYELPPRKAKEFLLAGQVLDAREALRLGMVNHVVALDALESRTMELASRIARKPMFALKLAKEALNAAQDHMGRKQAMGTAFALHQLCHAHNVHLHDFPIDYSQLHPKVQAAIRDYISRSGGDPFGMRPQRARPDASRDV